MSKSKLNRRQLKKISRLAVNHILGNPSKYKVLKSQVSLDDYDEAFYGEFTIWQPTGFGDYDGHSTLDALFDSFHELHTVLPTDFKSLSYANKVHYMIKFLEEV
ncbi:hypothetical protein HX037_06555 [Ignatzschineria indica]|uniref:hypothetical protein n=1 Tax=Ignatzschineria indica TaxID=472583 RepID=UPI002578EB01|nr:hypothetical protein [Ignatzschineria indica]MDM1545545.1 hypothetical protein [Ignatzschineria indica]